MPDLLVTLASGAGCVLVSPYLARLSVSVPDRNARDWWRGRAASAPRRTATALTALVFGLLAGAGATNVLTGSLALLPAYLWLAVVGTPLAVIDAEHQRLPDRLMAPLAIGEAALLGVSVLGPVDLADGVRAVGAAAAVFAALFAVAFASPRSFGFGDVKLGGVLGGCLGVVGWPSVLGGLVAGFVIGAVVGVASTVGGRRTLKSTIPFGPMLVLGALLVLALSTVEP